MKKFILFVMLCMPATLVAQNGVTVSNLAMGVGTVTFNISWNRNAMPELLWSDTVWVFVDYNNNGVMKRLPLSMGATLTATSAPGVGKVMPVDGNNQGVWVVGNARSAGSFSAIVKLLTVTAEVAGACAYASNYPPVGEYTSATEIAFTGTSEYDITIKKDIGGTMETRTSGSLFTVPNGYTLQSFTDKTGAPGMMNISPATYSLSGSDGCAGSTVTLTLSGSQSGWKYQLHKGSTAVGTVVDGTGSAITFSDISSVTGGFSYTVRTVDNPAVVAQRVMQVSDVRAITVQALPVITAQPANVSICSGSTALLSVTAGNATAYRWWKNGSATSEGSGTASNQYTTTALTAGATYSVIVANGACSVTSGNAVVSMATSGCCTAPGATVNFTAFNPCTNATTGATWTLQDTRESNNNQSYKVKKMADGHIWMVQDLKFGNLCGTSFSGSSSNQTGKVSSIGTYYGDCTAASYPITPVKRGYFYDWAGAINKAGAYYGSTSNPGCSGTSSGTSGTNPGACQGICPSGWHIPTGTSSGEYKALHNAIGGCSTTNDDCWDADSLWEGMKGGNCGVLGGLESQNSNAYYWSSTRYSDQTACSLYFSHAIVRPSTDTYDKNLGFLVRCVRNF
jgi:uncharacterized protein (TIGR02145 family)